MKLSQIGQLLAADTPIVQLMTDLGEALNESPNSLFLGGGNPAHVPAAQSIFQRHLQSLAQAVPHDVLGVYQSPQGNREVLNTVAGYLQRQCDWPVTRSHIALVAGSQTALFILFNLFAGGGKKISLPIVPEYVGYGSQVLHPESFVPCRPNIVSSGDHRFKYTVDLSRLNLTPEIHALCASVPTNPSGNVLSGQELRALDDIAGRADIPLILDYAYGLPFPGLVYEPVQPYWSENAIVVMSLSKLGLPGVRCSVVVARPEVIDLVSKANTVLTLAGGNIGPHLLKSLIDSGDMAQLSQELLPAYYCNARDFMVQQIEQKLAPFNYRLHQTDGAFFCWLWLPELKITAQELYQRLKQKGVIVMPGESFFFGLEQHWPHAQQCLRLSYCQPEEVIRRAIEILAEELKGIA